MYLSMLVVGHSQHEATMAVHALGLVSVVESMGACAVWLEHAMSGTGLVLAACMEASTIGVCF